MVSLRRRQVIIAALATAAAPAALALLPEAEAKLVLSGRVVAADGNPVPGAQVVAGAAVTDTDADGRFLLHTNSRHYRITGLDSVAEGIVANAHADIDGTWRATLSVPL